MHGRAKGTADHYWPWAVFFKILKSRQGSRPEGDHIEQRGEFPSIRGGRGSLRLSLSFRTSSGRIIGLSSHFRSVAALEIVQLLNVTLLPEFGIKTHIF